MAKQEGLFLAKGTVTSAVTFTSADTTGAKLIHTSGGGIGGAEDSDVKYFRLVSDDTAIVNFRWYIRKSSLNYQQGCIRVPAGSGTDGANPPIDGNSSAVSPGLPLDQVFKPYVKLQSGDQIWGACLATMTVAKTLTVTVAEDYF